jgi:hypothetical protein
MASFPIHQTESLTEFIPCTLLIDGGLSSEPQKILERLLDQWSDRFSQGDDPPLDHVSELDYHESELGTAVEWVVEFRKDDSGVLESLIGYLERFVVDSSVPIARLIFGDCPEPWESPGKRIPI